MQKVLDMGSQQVPEEAAAMKIEPYVHRCVIQDGPLQGNKYWHEVSWYDIEYQELCSNCGQILCTPEQAIAHVYRDLTEVD